MAKKPSPDKVKGPGTLHGRAGQGYQRNQAAGKQHNKLAQPQNRWQRTARYVWDKGRGGG